MSSGLTCNTFAQTGNSTPHSLILCNSVPVSKLLTVSLSHYQSTAAIDLTVVTPDNSQLVHLGIFACPMFSKYLFVALLKHSAPLGVHDIV